MRLNGKEEGLQVLGGSLSALHNRRNQNRAAPVTIFFLWYNPRMQGSMLMLAVAVSRTFLRGFVHRHGRTTHVEKSYLLLHVSDCQSGITASQAAFVFCGSTQTSAEVSPPGTAESQVGLGLEILPLPQKTDPSLNSVQGAITMQLVTEGNVGKADCFINIDEMANQNQGLPGNQNDDELMILVAGHVAAVIIMALEDDDPEPEEEGARITVNVNAWGQLGGLAFQSHFRMSKELFENLLQTTANHLVDRGRLIRTRTPLHICLLAVLWILATIDTFRSTSLKFNMSPGVLHFHYRYFIEALREMAPRFISWPNAQERIRIKRTFERRTGYPDCVGSVDGTHIYTTAPLINAMAYVNRFFKYSIIAQAVVDCDMVVRDLYVGEPGSMHDARVLGRSPLGTRLYTDPTMFAPGEHIVGDGAYMLTDKVQTPYRWNNNFDPARRLFNRILSSTRIVVERAFGLLKGKFRRLKHFHSLSLEYAVDHIVASFVLHNFILLDGLPYNEDVLQDIIVNDDGVAEGLNRNGPIMRAARAAGAARRERMAAIFSGLPVND